MASKRKKIVLSVEQKLKALETLDKRESTTKVAKELGIAERTVKDWRKNKDQRKHSGRSTLKIPKLKIWTRLVDVIYAAEGSKLPATNAATALNRMSKGNPNYYKKVLSMELFNSLYRDDQNLWNQDLALGPDLQDMLGNQNYDTMHVNGPTSVHNSNGGGRAYQQQETIVYVGSYLEPWMGLSPELQHLKSETIIEVPNKGKKRNLKKRFSKRSLKANFQKPKPKAKASKTKKQEGIFMIPVCQNHPQNTVPLTSFVTTYPIFDSIDPLNVYINTILNDNDDFKQF